MQISILSVAAPYRGGIAEQTSLMFKEFKKEHSVKIINFKRQYPDFLFPGKSQHDKDVNPELLNDNFQIIDSINPFSWKKAVNCILENPPNLLLLRYWNPFFAISYGYIVKKIKKISPDTKIVSICDNILPHERHFYDTFLTKYLFNNIDAFIVMSEKVESQLLAFYPESHYKRVFHPIENREMRYSKNQIKEEMGISAEKIILFYGFIRSYKGLDILIKSNRYLMDLLNDYKIIICGESYEDKKKYIQMISENSNLNEIIWIDEYASDKVSEKFFTISDLVVLPYKNASQSGVIPLSYTYETPVIASDISGIREMVLDGKTGYLFKKNDSLDLSKKINKFFNSSEDFTSNIIEFRKNFSWDSFAKHIIELQEAL